MNIFTALIGLSSFVFAVTLMCVMMYRHTDSLEAWAKRRLGREVGKGGRDRG